MGNTNQKAAVDRRAAIACTWSDLSLRRVANRWGARRQRRSDASKLSVRTAMARVEVQKKSKAKKKEIVSAALCWTACVRACVEVS